MEVFVGVSDTKEVFGLYTQAKARGDVAGYLDDVLAEIKRVKPETVEIVGATLRTCVRHLVEECLDFGISEVVVDLRKCRTGATTDIGDNPEPEQLILRRLALTSWLGDASLNPRLMIIP